MCLCSSHEYNLNIDYVYFSVEQSISYSCQQCDKQYKYKNNLRRHIRHECNQEPKFCCEICPKRFKQKGHLKSHYLVHMNIDDKKMFMKQFFIVCNSYRIYNNTLCDVELVYFESLIAIQLCSRFRQIVDLIKPRVKLVKIDRSYNNVCLSFSLWNFKMSADETLLDQVDIL